MNAMAKRLVWAALILAIAGLLPAAEAAPKVKLSPKGVAERVSASVEPVTAKRGQTVQLRITADLAEDWYTYPAVRLASDSPGQNANAFTFPASTEVVFVGEVKDPATKTKKDEEGRPIRYLDGKVVWERPMVVRPDAKPGSVEIKFSIKISVCDKNSCLPPKVLPLTAALTISDAEPVPVEPKYQDAVKKVGSTGVQAPKPGPVEAIATKKPGQGDPADQAVEVEASPDHKRSLADVAARIVAVPTPGASGGLMAFVLSGVFWGFVSLITPCVFPMIPITVSFFLKQSEKEHHNPVLLALIYCATIVGVLTVSAVALLSFFRGLSVNPYMNFGLGGLFIFFALSLFGMYEIELPSFLSRYTSSREGQGGVIGTIFMALTFTIISFACVAPFLGGFGGTATATRFAWWELALGGLAFATTFASPFFVLALFPSLLKQMPRSGSWLNSVKVVMGFLELAAAFKFFRAGELVLLPQPAFFTYDFVLGMWIALLLLCGLYLLGVYRLPHDTAEEHLTVPRLLLSAVFLSLGFYLLPALFKTHDGENQRPGGSVYAWVDSFLLPEPAARKGELAWGGDLKRAIDEASNLRRRTGERKLVFIDFTGETCTNCKINEKSVFSKPEIKELFQPYRLVQLYTDKVPDRFYPADVRSKFGNDTERQRADAAANLWFQRETFGTEQLPLYVILEPLSDGTIQVAGSYDEGKINDESAFSQFLKKPLEVSTGPRAEAR
jgi:thiol:disulfide interchange protein DsbD